MSSTTINPNVQKWIDALRSGNYEQGKYALNLNGKMCCLGVACEVAMENGVPLKIEQDGKVTKYDGADVHPPLAVRDWLGLTTPGGGFIDPKTGTQNFLVKRNDSGASFAEIANIIESNPEGLFSRSEKLLS